MKRIMIALWLTVAAVSAQAQGLFGMDAQPNSFSYTYIEAHVLHMDFRNLNGIRTHGSLQVMPNLSVIGSVTGAARSQVDHQAITAGVAYHQQLQGTVLEKTDFIIHLEVEGQRTKIRPNNAPSSSSNDKGLIIGAGLRNELLEGVEIFGDFSMRTTRSTDLFVTLGSRYTVLPQLQLVASVEASSNDTVMFGARYSF